MKLMRFIGVCQLGCSCSLLQAASPETIRVTTGKTDLILKVDTTGGCASPTWVLSGTMDVIWTFCLRVKMLTSLVICKTFSSRLYA